MKKITNTSDVVDDDDKCLAAPAASSAPEDEMMTKTISTRGIDESGQGPRRSRSRSPSSSYWGPTMYRQSLQALPPDRPAARVVHVESYALHSVLRRSHPYDQDDVIVPE